MFAAIGDRSGAADILPRPWVASGEGAVDTKIAAVPDVGGDRSDAGQPGHTEQCVSLRGKNRRVMIIRSGPSQSGPPPDLTTMARNLAESGATYSG
jgi:hypothetical protein